MSSIKRQLVSLVSLSLTACESQLKRTTATTTTRGEQLKKLLAIQFDNLITSLRHPNGRRGMHKGWARHFGSNFKECHVNASECV